MRTIVVGYVELRRVVVVSVGSSDQKVRFQETVRWMTRLWYERHAIIGTPVKRFANPDEEAKQLPTRVRRAVRDCREENLGEHPVSKLRL